MKKKLKWVAYTTQHQEDLEQAKLEEAHAWHALGSHQHRYIELLFFARRMLDGVPISPDEFKDIERFVRNAPEVLIEEKKLKDATAYLLTEFAKHVAK